MRRWKTHKLTYEALLHLGQARLEQAGIETPRLEARLLLSAAAQIAPEDMIMYAQDAVTDAAAAQFERHLVRREMREPLQHILAETGFHTIVLKTDNRALIPRHDSETVVDLALAKLPVGQAAQIADLGTGSGCLLLAILQARPYCTGLGIDQSADAIALAQENADLTGLKVRARFAHLSWTDWPDWDEFDLIISNPPYIRSAQIADLAPEVRDYDPIDALDGGDDGLSAYRQIIQLAAHKMRPGTYLVLEIGFDQRQAVSELLNQAGFSQLEAHQDLAGQDRALCVLKN